MGMAVVRIAFHDFFTTKARAYQWVCFCGIFQYAVFAYLFENKKMKFSIDTFGNGRYIRPTQDGHKRSVHWVSRIEGGFIYEVGY